MLYYFERDYKEIDMGGCFLGMSGRNDFTESIKRIIASGQHDIVFMALDISNFKYINDFYGMDEGDRVMHDIANFYFMNEKRCLAAHGIGFDQFRALYSYEGQTKEELLDYIVSKNDEFERELSKRYPLVYHHVYVGLYFYENDDIDVRMALDRANIAKKTTKGKYDVRYRIYSDENSNKNLEYMDVSNLFVKACANDDIEMFLQPKVSASKDRVVGAEALVRLRDEEGKIVMPAKFITVLENTGMICRLDDIMIEKTFALQKECIDKGYKVVPISVNVSRHKFTNREFLDFVVALKDKYKVDPSLIEFEILETTFINAMESMVDTIEALRNIGFKIAVDDFGSGYSTLNQISNIPADVIKLDRVFSSRSLKSDKGRKVVKALIAMLTSVNYEIVFEGVEDEEELGQVVSFGCDVIQGYYYSKPIPAKEFISKYY